MYCLFLCQSIKAIKFMSLGGLIRRNTVWILGGNLSYRGFQFFVGVILARILVPEDFGLLVTLQIFTGTLGFIAGGGMGEALVQAKSVDEKDFKVVFTVQFVICILIYTALFVISPFLSEWFSEPRYTDLLRVSALTFIVRPFSNIPRAKLRREMQFKTITIIRLISMVIGASFSILLALEGFDTWSLIIGGLVGSLCSLLLLLYTTKWFPGFAYRKDSIRRLGGYGIKISTNEIILHLRNQAPNLIISRLLGADQVGLFNKGDSTASLPVNMISGSTYQTVFRALSTIQTDLDQSKYIYFRTITLVSIYTFPFYIGLFWIAEPFILFVYGEKWIDSSLPLQILTITGFFRSLTIPSGAVIAAQNRLGKEIIIQIQALVLFIIASIIGVKWGIIGVAIALIPCYLFFTLRMTNLANQCITGNYSDLAKALQPAAILNSFLFIVLLIVDYLLPEGLRASSPGIYLLIFITVGGLTYASLFLSAPIPRLDAEKKRWLNHLPFYTK